MGVVVNGVWLLYDQYLLANLQILGNISKRIVVLWRKNWDGGNI
jgi:hypothetical protein